MISLIQRRKGWSEFLLQFRLAAATRYFIATLGTMSVPFQPSDLLNFSYFIANRGGLLAMEALHAQ